MLRREMSDVKVIPDALSPSISASFAAPTAIRGPSAIQIPLQIEPGGDHSLHEQISDQIRQLIAEGKLRPGSYIPSSRQLADHLGVSRNTVLLAFNRLASEGCIEATKGSHTFVSQSYAKFRSPPDHYARASPQTMQFAGHRSCFVARRRSWCIPDESQYSIFLLAAPAHVTFRIGPGAGCCSSAMPQRAHPSLNIRIRRGCSNSATPSPITLVQHAE